MIALQNIMDDDKSLFTILFDKEVLRHLNCKCDDYLVVFQSRHNPFYFLIVKGDNGYRIKRYSKMKKCYQINVGFKFNFIPEFDYRECSYFLKKNNIIRVILKP